MNYILFEDWEGDIESQGFVPAWVQRLLLDCALSRLSSAAHNNEGIRGSSLVRRWEVAPNIEMQPQFVADNEKVEEANYSDKYSWVLMLRSKAGLGGGLTAKRLTFTNRNPGNSSSESRFKARSSFSLMTRGFEMCSSSPFSTKMSLAL